MLTGAGHRGISSYTARLLTYELGTFPVGTSHAHRLLIGLQWEMFVRLHLTDQEQLRILLALAPTGRQRRGFDATSRELFGRAPRELTLPELATIVALTRFLTARGTRLDRVRDSVLARYESAARGRIGNGPSNE